MRVSGSDRLAGMEHMLTGASGQQYRFFFMRIGSILDSDSVMLETKTCTYVFADMDGSAVVIQNIGWTTRGLRGLFAAWRKEDGTIEQGKPQYIGTRLAEDERLVRGAAEDLRAAYLPDAG